MTSKSGKKTNTRKGVFFYIRPRNLVRLAVKIMRVANIKPRINAAVICISKSRLPRLRNDVPQGAWANSPFFAGRSALPKINLAAFDVGVCV